MVRLTFQHKPALQNPNTVVGPSKVNRSLVGTEVTSADPDGQDILAITKPKNELHLRVPLTERPRPNQRNLRNPFIYLPKKLAQALRRYPKGPGLAAFKIGASLKNS